MTPSASTVVDAQFPANGGTMHHAIFGFDRPASHPARLGPRNSTCAWRIRRRETALHHSQSIRLCPVRNFLRPCRQNRLQQCSCDPALVRIRRGARSLCRCGAQRSNLRHGRVGRDHVRYSPALGEYNASQGSRESAAARKLAAENPKTTEREKTYIAAISEIFTDQAIASQQEKPDALDSRRRPTMPK